MRTRTTLLLSAFLATSVLLAQSLGEIHGKVLDENGAPLFLANVSTDRGDGLIGTTTDEKGRFVLKPLVPGTYTVRISFVGMVTREVNAIQVNPDKITFLGEQVMASNTTLPEIEIVATRWLPPLIDPEEPSKITVIASQFKDNPLRKNPVAMLQSISPDIYKAPNSDELYFRGSRSGSMAYYIDGVKVTGGLSGVPPGSMASITVYTGGLPARYGDVTGGVVAIETKSYFDLYMQEKAGVR
ncbi:MAG: carboxypeptidase regulatory-like domain-containing protein [Flavobacteriales bacterium]|nr:carboxypeptidase regulatory-like domain-containing protein [Flavobacteriales bacterium]